MSMMAPGSSGEWDSDEYHSAPEELSAGFLTPSFPFDEGRRDSVMSMNSSYCSLASEYSSHTDYSMPVSPTCGQSPLAQQTSVEHIQYGMGPPMHGLSLLPQDGSFGNIPATTMGLSFQHHDTPADSTWGSCPPTPQTTVPAGPFHAHTGLPTSRELNTAFHHHILGPRDHSNTEAAWDNLSTTVWPRFQGPWDSANANNFQMPPATIMPSDAMMDDYVQISSDTFDNTESSFVQSPQEVSFEGQAPMIKSEPDVDEGAGRMRFGSRVYVRSTGAKSVKKEPTAKRGHQRGSLRKRRAANAKTENYKYTVKCEGDELEVEVEKGIVADASGKLRKVGDRPFEWKYCRQCTRKFQRDEHLKRHEKTHSGKMVAGCVLCPRQFNRNDNCIAHYYTHIQLPNAKSSTRNSKYPVEEVTSALQHDPKMREKVRAWYAKKRAQQEHKAASRMRAML